MPYIRDNGNVPVDISSQIKTRPLGPLPTDTAQAFLDRISSYSDFYRVARAAGIAVRNLTDSREESPEVEAPTGRAAPARFYLRRDFRDHSSSVFSDTS